ncbi:MAG: DUF58 domain-containing protein [Thiolinea sp.]
MTRTLILPATRSFQLLLINIAVALLVSIFPNWLPVWHVVLGGSVLLWVIDALLALPKPKLRIERHLPQSLPVGVETTIRLTSHNESRRPLSIRLYDHIPADFSVQGMPVHLHLPQNKHAEVSYSIKPLKRGLMRFAQIQMRVLSPLQLWWRDTTSPLESEVRVYPNFAAISQYALLATDNHLSHLGIMKRRRRGEGQDFHQLREYRAGDSLGQIDWKASARMQKPVAREYQDERDQEIIFLLDCSHRMLAKDDELSHFDHTLNAILLLSHVALKQGDAVGLGTFGGEERWLIPRKGQPCLNQILNALYDLHATSQAPDFSQAATELLIRQKKRALVIVLSNLRDEDTDDLLPALHLLRNRHLLLFASMQEQALNQQLTDPVDNIEDALQHAATEHYLSARAQTLQKVRSNNVLCLDTPPDKLSTGLINSYLDIKRSGVL